MAVGVSVGVARTNARLLRKQTRWERARARLTWRLVCLAAPLVKPFAHLIWQDWKPSQLVTVTLETVQRYGWDAAIADLLALSTLTPLGDVSIAAHAGASESRGWRLDISEDHWGDLHYSAVARTPQDTRPTLETLAETQATSPLARNSGVGVRYRRLIEDDPTCELVAAIADLPTAPLLPTVQPAAVAAVEPRAEAATEWRPAQAGSLSVASLIDTGSQRHLDDLWWGMQQPVTQPLPAALRQQRQQLTPPTTPTPVTVPVLTPVREEVEVPASC